MPILCTKTILEMLSRRRIGEAFLKKADFHSRRTGPCEGVACGSHPGFSSFCHYHTGQTFCKYFSPLKTVRDLTTLEHYALRAARLSSVTFPATSLLLFPLQLSLPRFLLDSSRAEPQDLELLKRSIGLVYREDSEETYNYYRVKVSAERAWWVTVSLA